MREVTFKSSMLTALTTFMPAFCRLTLDAHEQRSGKVDFDEFLDIMWKVEHAKGARSVLFRRTEAFVEGSFAAAQVALKRMPTHSRQNQEVKH